MPTEAEIANVSHVINELTAGDRAAMKAGRKKPSQVAETLLGYVKDAESEAAKFVLMRDAFGLYLDDGAIDKAIGVVKRMEKSVRDFKGEVFHEKIGLAFAAKGQWKSALIGLRKCGGKMAEIVEWEKSYPETGVTELTTASVGDFWWNKAEEHVSSPKVAAALRVHAAQWLKEAIKNGSVRGLEKTLAEKRIAAAEKVSGSVSPDVKRRREKDLYMVVDLTKTGSRAVTYLDEAPKGGWSDEFRTNKIVLRRIAPGSFEYMPGRSFKISKPFYIGIFEVTQAQYEMIMKANPSEFKGGMRPVEKVSYIDIRGGRNGLNWPQNGKVDNDSYLGKMRKQFGLEFDLPTAVQWEYACRAETTGNLNVDGAEMVKLGKCRDNGGETDHHVKVGSFQPNAWGLYDMLGNVWEWCVDRGPAGKGAMDWTVDAKETETDPKGPAVGESRIRRGGGWGRDSRSYRSSLRDRYDAGSNWRFNGFRLACPSSRSAKTAR